MASPDPVTEAITDVSRRSERLAAALTEEQQESLDEDESILLDSPIPDAELDTLESCIRLCGEGIDILDARCLYAVACNKHTRDMYEANIGAVQGHPLLGCLSRRRAVGGNCVQAWSRGDRQDAGSQGRIRPSFSNSSSS